MWETREKECVRTVCKPVTETFEREVRETVCRPVWETRERQIQICTYKPVEETINVRRCVQEPGTCTFDPCTCKYVYTPGASALDRGALHGHQVRAVPADPHGAGARSAVW